MNWRHAAEESRFGIVGTITLRGKSAVVWLGWGAIESDEDGESAVVENNGVVSIGNGTSLLYTL